jgi:calcineurin-like phosphoesterase family protein
MIRVVPLVHLSNEAFRDIRAPIEISDARDVLWSHYPRTQPITARDEARLLRTLLRENVTLTPIGKHQPQETRDPLTIHNLKVAKLLKRDEQPL